MQGWHLVDSSVWLEYFIDGPNAGCFAEPLSDPNRLVVPTVSLFEVFRAVLRERGDDDAIRAAAPMRRDREIPLSPHLAARLAHEGGLAMADGIILATARSSGATLRTQDADFEDLAGVRYFAKASR